MRSPRRSELQEVRSSAPPARQSPSPGRMVIATNPILQFAEYKVCTTTGSDEGADLPRRRGLFEHPLLLSPEVMIATRWT
jgi:hypothetical protein